MKNSGINYQNLKLNLKKEKGCSLTLSDNNFLATTGTCLGECVKCGASCCMDAGHPGPHFCYLCK